MRVIGAGFGRTGTLSLKRALEDLGFVVLTVRDPRRWWASTESTIYRFRTVFPGWLLRLVPTIRDWLEMTDRLVWDGLFDGRFADRDHAVDVFERHLDHVRATCPPERLLVFDVAQGWEPLCAFLDVPVPRHPFPHLNDARVMRRRLAGLRWGTRVAPIVIASAAAALAVRTRKARSNAVSVVSCR